MVELKRILKAEEMLQHQKSRCKQLKEVDGNTNFFHKVANGRTRKNLTPSLVINGKEVENFEKIVDEYMLLLQPIQEREKE